jgi:hypothetical protein
VAERNGPAAIEEQGTFIVGSPGTREVLSSPSMKSGLGIAVNNSRTAAVASCDCGNEAQGAVTVP